MTKILDWDEYFMSVSYVSSLRSKDANTKVGACIVDDNNRIVSIGYNGMPNGCDDSIMPWGKGEGLDDKSFYVVHAELNAILNSKANLNNCKLYATLFPCNECTKAIIQSGIKEIIYLDDKHYTKDEYRASRYMLDVAGIKHRKLITNMDFDVDLKIGDN